MAQIINREEFDEVLDAINQIKSAQAEHERDLKFLSMKIPDSRIAYRFPDYLREDKKLNRKLAKQYAQKSIGILGERKEQIVKRMENEFSDRHGNIRRFVSGKRELIMTNPTSGKTYTVSSVTERTALYCILILERRISENLPVHRSDYAEIEKYLRIKQCVFPEELFII